MMASIIERVRPTCVPICLALNEELVILVMDPKRG